MPDIEAGHPVSCFTVLSDLSLFQHVFGCVGDIYFFLACISLLAMHTSMSDCCVWCKGYIGISIAPLLGMWKFKGCTPRVWDMAI